MDRSVQFTFLMVMMLCGGIILFRSIQPAPVQVKPLPVPKPQPASIAPLGISAPSTGMVNKEIEFKITDLTATDSDIEWSFGVSGNIDARIPNPRYVYTKAGNYTITLHAKNRPYISKAITISGTVHSVTPVQSSSLCPEVTKGQLQDLFQKFLSATNDGSRADVKRQLQGYFSNPNLENLIVDGNYRNSSGFSLSSWCRMVELDNMKTVTITGEPKRNATNCITLVQLDSHK